MPYSRRRRSGDDRSSDNSSSSSVEAQENSAANEERPWFKRIFSWLFGGSEQEEQAPETTRPATDNEVVAVEEAVGDRELPGLLDEAANEVEEPVETRERARDRAEDVAEKLTIQEGSFYEVSAEDASSFDPWKQIARAHGMSAEHLQAFNQHIVTVQNGDQTTQHTETTEMVAGAQIYIPSAQEIMFAQCRQQVATYDEAVSLYGELAEGPNVKLMTKARERASGRVGESYGTKGVDGGWFLTENPELAGARSTRTEQANGKTQYKVFWVDDFWKCSLYMHDVVWSAGYKPHQTSNDHYQLAGKLHQSPMYEEVAAKDARPGDCYQRFGGMRSNESHNAFLSSFIQVEDAGDYEEWTFSIVGAESEMAAESERTHRVKKGTQETSAGKILRFFRPTETRQTNS